MRRSGLAQMTWAVNPFYESEEDHDDSKCPNNPSDKLSEFSRISNYISDENLTDTTPHRFSRSNSMLPAWLKEKEHMIYSPSFVKKEHQIGHGQYGSVFKGKNLLATAV